MDVCFKLISSLVPFLSFLRFIVNRFAAVSRCRRTSVGRPSLVLTVCKDQTFALIVLENSATITSLRSGRKTLGLLRIVTQICVWETLGESKRGPDETLQHRHKSGKSVPGEIAAPVSEKARHERKE